MSEAPRWLAAVAVALGLTASAPARAQWGGPTAAPTTSAQPAPAPAPTTGAPSGQPAAPPSGQPSPYDPSMQAGGLAPPPPMNGTPPAQTPPGETEQRLDQAKQKDSGRGLDWVWINVEGGFEHVGLQTFNVDEQKFSAGFITTTQSGPVIGAGAGVQLLFLQLGARARVGFFSEWQLFSVGGEVGFHIPIGNLEPHFELGFGYTGLGSFAGAIQGANDAINIRGFYGRVGGGLDYFVTPVFSVGADFGWELLGLTRPGVSTADLNRIQGDPKYQQNPDQARLDALKAEGTSYGSALAITAVLGLHF